MAAAVQSSEKPIDILIEEDLEAQHGLQVTVSNGPNEAEVVLGADLLFKNRQKPTTILEWCERLAAVDAGCYMKTKSGVSGETPAQDSFPWFSSTETHYVQILWDLSPSDYRLVSFNSRPFDGYDPDAYLQGKQILIQDVTEVMLEPAPSDSFRIYLGETQQVVRLTPLAPSNQSTVTSHTLAALWVDAMYTAMHLQNEEAQFIALGINEGTNQDCDSREEDSHVNTAPTESIDFMELRDQYFALYPEQKPVPVPVPPEDKHSSISLLRVPSQDGQTSRRFSASSLLDFAQIYKETPQRDDIQDLEAHHVQTAESSQHGCCVIA